jgi:hypothetical protein
VAIRAGEPCFHCRKPISQPELAAQIIDHSQRSYQFSSVTCLVDYLKSHPGIRSRRCTRPTTDVQGGAGRRGALVAFKPNPQRRGIEHAAFCRARRARLPKPQERRAHVGRGLRGGAARDPLIEAADAGRRAGRRAAGSAGDRRARPCRSGVPAEWATLTDFRQGSTAGRAAVGHLA